MQTDQDQELIAAVHLKGDTVTKYFIYSMSYCRYTKVTGSLWK